jgi:hypothetical protein
MAGDRGAELTGVVDVDGVGPSGWGAALGSSEALGPVYGERGGGEVAWHRRSGEKHRRVRR